MKMYIKPTIGGAELRPEEGLACTGSEGVGYNGGTAGGFPTYNYSNPFGGFDWGSILKAISGLFGRGRH